VQQVLPVLKHLRFSFGFLQQPAGQAKNAKLRAGSHLLRRASAPHTLVAIRDGLYSILTGWQVAAVATCS
jgi:hypothetical protein